MNALLQDGSREGSPLMRGFVFGIVLALCAGPGAIAAKAGAVHGPWTLGHGDLSVTYSGTGDAFGSEVHLHTGAVVDGETLTTDEHGEPSEIQIVVPVAANLRRIDNPTGFFEGGTGYDFTGSDFNATGATVGGNLWMLGGSADAAHYGTPFVGLSAEELTAAEWSGQISLVFSGLAFDGSAYGTTGGVFSFYSEELTAMWSSVGSFSQQSVGLVPGAGHIHGFMFFSQPGTYEVTLLANGTLVEGNAPVSGSSVYTFQVVPEPSSIALAGLGAAGVLAAGWRRRRRTAAQNSAAAERAR